MTDVYSSLRQLGARARSLSGQRREGSVVVMGGGNEGERILGTISEVCRLAESALQTGVDANGDPISRSDVANGLRRLADDVRNPSSVGALAVFLGSGATHEVTKLADDMEMLAELI